ncbi:RNA polymerase sigma factor [Runella aurantiaca]|uniref:RNA polymerase sigma factor n=1 Tax=Runella aurantiaca TaxID=2282308 RepID=UPI001314D242|nr:sigma-70 family RNA polymerase sigma factor [Runella aurantiaca]
MSFLKQEPRKAFELLYKCYGRQFYGFAVKNWKFDEDSAWEVIYSTLEQLVSKLDRYSFESQSDFDRFAFKTFLNFLRQRYRHDSRLQKAEWVSLEDISEGEIETFDIDDDNIKENKSLTRLKLALEQISKNDQELLLLRAQGFSYEEIAGLLSIENNQLKVQYFRAKERLIKRYNEIDL